MGFNLLTEEYVYIHKNIKIAECFVFIFYFGKNKINNQKYKC